MGEGDPVPLYDRLRFVVFILSVINNKWNLRIGVNLVGVLYIMLR